MKSRALIGGIGRESPQLCHRLINGEVRNRCGNPRAARPAANPGESCDFSASAVFSS